MKSNKNQTTRLEYVSVTLTVGVCKFNGVIENLELSGNQMKWERFQFLRRGQFENVTQEIVNKNIQEISRCVRMAVKNAAYQESGKV